MLQKLLCLIGRHGWQTFGSYGTRKYRCCKYCGKEQDGHYDLATQTTYWETISKKTAKE